MTAKPEEKNARFSGYSERAGGQSDEQVRVVRLNLCLVRGFTADDGTAFFALVEDDEAAACIGLDPDRAKQSAAGICTVAGVDVNVQGTEAEGTVISRRRAEGQNLPPAVFAEKARVVFPESLGFHSDLPSAACAAVFCPFFWKTEVVFLL